MKILFTPKAKESLGKISHYIAIENHSPENADNFIDGMLNNINKLLSDFPEIGKMITSRYRFIVYKRYTITYTYKPEKEEVVILNIYSPGRNWKVSP